MSPPVSTVAVPRATPSVAFTLVLDLCRVSGLSPAERVSALPTLQALEASVEGTDAHVDLALGLRP